MIRIGSRASALALRQVAELCAHVPGLDYTVVPFDTYGDRHHEQSLLEPTAPDFFTDALDAAVREGAVDLAVHSAKDVPYPLPHALDVIALTAARETRDALVSRGRVALAELPPGARVGTSSSARCQQLLAARADLVPVGIRGTIEERLALIERGVVDAVIVAACALERLGLGERIAAYLPFVPHPLQGALAVTARRDRPALRRLLFACDVRRTWGQCWLIGAGPGDPDLLTRRAWHVLARADVVLHDALIDARVLAACRGRRIDVGKRKGAHARTQDEINALLYECVRCGHQTVRLKNGDPFVFGRGGEEYDYLRRRLVPVNVVPGVTAACAAAADAGIALTQRGMADTLVLHSGHAAAPAAPAGATHVVYMGVTVPDAVRDRLTAAGVGPDTPVAVVERAGGPAAVRRDATLASLPALTAQMPAVIIAGRTAGVHDHQPRALYTGLDPCAARVPMRVVHYPVIATRPLAGPAALPAAGDALMFTSRTAVDCCRARWPVPAVPVLVIGTATAAAARAAGFTVTHMPDEATADALARLLATLPYRCVVYPCSARARNALHALPQVCPLPLYTTDTIAQPALDLTQYDGVVFSSSSTVAGFFAIYPALPPHLACFAFGMPTHAALRAHGVPVEQLILLQPGV